MNNLEKALTNFIDEPKFLAPLADILDYSCENGKISYDETLEITGESADEVLLLANRWRLLLPIRMMKSGAWEDLLLICQSGESYTMPNIDRYLVQNARNTGAWDTTVAITSIFKKIEETNWHKIPTLIIEIGKNASNNQISGDQIIKVCIGTGMGVKVDVLIAELKATGIISPKLGPLAEIARVGSPIYELNPSLFTKV